MRTETATWRMTMDMLRMTAGHPHGDDTALRTRSETLRTTTGRPRMVCDGLRVFLSAKHGPRDRRGGRSPPFLPL